MTRISTTQSQESAIASLQRRQQELMQSQDRLSSGKRVSKPSDDPTAAAQIERAVIDQTRAQGVLRSVAASRQAMSLVESSLGQAVDLTQSARESVVAAGNGTYGPQERVALAAKLKEVRGQLLSLGNTQDAAGNWVFGGQASDRPALVEGATGVTFQGRSGEVSASSSESMPLSVDGQSIWMGARSGNGVFETSAQTTAASSAWISAGAVSNPSALALADGQHYSLSFDTGAAQYSVSLVQADGSSAPFPDAANSTHAYVSGQAITALPGMTFNITGTPAAGDKFTVQPSTADLNVFKAIDRVVAVLDPQPGQLVDNADVAQAVNSGLRDLDQVLSQLQAARSQSGETLNRLDGVDNRSNLRVLSAQAARSDAEDLDMVQAISDFSTKQAAYQAALKSYSNVSNHSLFDYIGN